MYVIIIISARKMCMTYCFSEKQKECPYVMTFKEAKPKFNWDIVFLIGGGFALADGSEVSRCFHK